MSYLERLRALEIAHKHPTPTDKTAKTEAADTQGPAQGTDKTDETEPAAGIGGFGSTRRQAFPKIEGDEARPLWRIVQPGGQAWVSCFAPPATFKQVSDWYPGALIEPVSNSNRGEPLAVEADARILAWRDAIGEDCPQARAEYLQQTQVHPNPNPNPKSDSTKLNRFSQQVLPPVQPEPDALARYSDLTDGAAAASESVSAPPAAIRTCGTCQHWLSDRVNPTGGLGTCSISAPTSRQPGSLWPASVHRCGDWKERRTPC